MSYTALVSEAMRELKDNEGFSIKFPYDPYNSPPDHGYMVSIEGMEKQLPLAKLSNNDIWQYIQGCQPEDGSYFGGWVDNGIVYLDNSVWIAKLENAKQFGWENHQLAIWDCANDESIKLSD